MAAPLAVFHDPWPGRYGQLVREIRELFPEAEIVEGVRSFGGTEDWSARWPEVLAGIDSLIFVADMHFLIGLGVYTEVRDAEAAGLSVGFYMLGGGRVFAASEFRVTVVNPADRMRYAKVTIPVVHDEKGKPVPVLPRADYGPLPAGWTVRLPDEPAVRMGVTV